MMEANDLINGLTIFVIMLLGCIVLGTFSRQVAETDFILKEFNKTVESHAERISLLEHQLMCLTTNDTAYGTIGNGYAIYTIGCNAKSAWTNLKGTRTNGCSVDINKLYNTTTPIRAIAIHHNNELSLFEYQTDYLNAISPRGIGGVQIIIEEHDVLEIRAGASDWTKDPIGNYSIRVYGDRRC